MTPLHARPSSTRCIFATPVMIKVGTGDLVRAEKQREALATGLAPLDPPNVQVRPVLRAARFISQQAVACAGDVHVSKWATWPRVHVAPPDAQRDRRMEDWSAEYTLM